VADPNLLAIHFALAVEDFLRVSGVEERLELDAFIGQPFRKREGRRAWKFKSRLAIGANASRTNAAARDTAYCSWEQIAPRNDRRVVGGD